MLVEFKMFLIGGIFLKLGQKIILGPRKSAILGIIWTPTSSTYDEISNRQNILNTTIHSRQFIIRPTFRPTYWLIGRTTFNLSLALGPYDNNEGVTSMEIFNLSLAPGPYENHEGFTSMNYPDSELLSP